MNEHKQTLTNIKNLDWHCDLKHEKGMNVAGRLYFLPTSLCFLGKQSNKHE